MIDTCKACGAKREVLFKHYLTGSLCEDCYKRLLTTNFLDEFQKLYLNEIFVGRGLAKFVDNMNLFKNRYPYIYLFKAKMNGMNGMELSYFVKKSREKDEWFTIKLVVNGSNVLESQIYEKEIVRYLWKLEDYNKFYLQLLDVEPRKIKLGSVDTSWYNCKRQEYSEDITDKERSPKKDLEIVKVKLRFEEKCDNDLHFSIEVGKKGYKRFLKEIGYRRTFKDDKKLGLYKIPDEDMVDYGVFVSEGVIYLDYNVNRDLVILKKMKSEDFFLRMSVKDAQKYIEDLMTKEFIKLNK